jgi:hypothetical protein
MFEYDPPRYEFPADKVFVAGANRNKGRARRLSRITLAPVRLMKLTSSILKKGIYADSRVKGCRSRKGVIDSRPAAEDYPFICGFAEQRRDQNDRM